MSRNLDGVYFRVYRDGKWQSLCFSDLTNDEREEVIQDKPVEWLKQMCRILADTIRNIGDTFDLMGEDTE